MKTHRAMFNKWNPGKKRLTPPLPANTYYPREWQEEGLYLIGENRRIINCPTAAGKSIFMQFISAKELVENPKQLDIFVIPETSIKGSFLGGWDLLYPDGEKVEWMIKEHNCLIGQNKGPDATLKVEGLKKFLKKKRGGDPTDRVAICFRGTFDKLYRELKEEGNLKLFNNTSIYIDEAHHIKNTEYELTGIDEETMLDQNCIGEVIERLCTRKKVKLTLVTATWIRGDRLSILPQGMMDQFERFHLPFDKFLASLKYLNSFSYDYCFYKGHWRDTIQKLWKQSPGTYLYFLPEVGSKCATEHKYLSVEFIVDAIADKRYPILKDDIGMISVVPKGGTERITIADLVTEEGREERKEHIEKYAKTKGGPDIIIALKMFQEGASYDFIDHIVMIGFCNSLLKIVQRMGRGFRDAKGKEHLSIYHLIPQSMDDGSEEFNKYFDDLFKAVLLTMLLENVLVPVHPLAPAEEGDRKERGPREIRPFVGLFSDETTMIDTFEEIVEQIVYEKSKDEPIKFRDNREAFNQIIDKVLKDNDIKDYDLEVVGEDVWKMLTIRPTENAGFDVSNIKDMFIEDAEPLDGMLRFTSGVCGVKTFDRIRQAIGAVPFRPFEEAREFVRNLGLKGESEYREWSRSEKRPSDIPSAPWRTYEEEWVDWGDWLGTGNTSNYNWLPFEEAREKAIELGLKSVTEWKELSKDKKRPSRIPANPNQVYKDKWQGWGDFLGTGNTVNNDWLPFEEAREKARELGLKSFTEWKELSKAGKRPKKIPGKPDQVYKDKWQGWGDFLGTGNTTEFDWWPFDKSRRFARKLGLKNSKEWTEWAKTDKKPKKLPATPHAIYKDEWQGMGDFLGTGNKRNHSWLSFKEAKKYIVSIKLKSAKEFRKWAKSNKRSRDIPSNPHLVYKNQWISWKDFLGY